MSESQSPESVPTPAYWQIENFYFGNAGTPSDVTYRTRGEQIQLRVEKVLPLRLREGTNHYDANADEISEFLTQYQDCQFTVADSYELRSGGRQAPSLLITGWTDLTEDQRYIYEQDKADAWKNPGDY